MIPIRIRWIPDIVVLLVGLKLAEFAPPLAWAIIVVGGAALAWGLVAIVRLDQPISERVLAVVPIALLALWSASLAKRGDLAKPEDLANAAFPPGLFLIILFRPGWRLSQRLEQWADAIGM